jgi:hypothetical protein
LLLDSFHQSKSKKFTVSCIFPSDLPAKKFSGKFARRIINGGVRHNLPQEAPKVFADTIIEVDGYSS